MVLTNVAWFWEYGKKRETQFWTYFRYRLHHTAKLRQYSSELEGFLPNSQDYIIA